MGRAKCINAGFEILVFLRELSDFVWGDLTKPFFGGLDARVEALCELAGGLAEVQAADAGL